MPEKIESDKLVIINRPDRFLDQTFFLECVFGKIRETIDSIANEIAFYREYKQITKANLFKISQTMGEGFFGSIKKLPKENSLFVSEKILGKLRLYALLEKARKMCQKGDMVLRGLDVYIIKEVSRAGLPKQYIPLCDRDIIQTVDALLPYLYSEIQNIPDDSRIYILKELYNELEENFDFEEGRLYSSTGFI